MNLRDRCMLSVALLASFGGGMQLRAQEKLASTGGVPLKNCNSLRNWAVAFFMIGRGNEKATVLFAVIYVCIHMPQIT